MSRGVVCVRADRGLTEMHPHGHGHGLGGKGTSTQVHEEIQAAAVRECVDGREALQQLLCRGSGLGAGNYGAVHA